MDSTNINELVKAKTLTTSNELPINPNTIREKYLYINDIDQVAHLKLLEHNVWYEGDGDSILNFYRGNMNIRYMYEPFFDENKRSYFRSVSSTETDFERVHVPLYRDIIDTLAALVGEPRITNATHKSIQENIDKIIKENSLNNLVLQQVVPLTLNEGWGCFKIDWDISLSYTPIIQYYRAENVDFVYKYKNKLTKVIFKDYFVKGGETFMLMETRSVEGVGTPTHSTSLTITKDIYQLDRNNNLLVLSNEEKKKLFPSLNLDTVTISSFPYLLAVPTIFFHDSSNIGYGRSIMDGKMDLFDALDQAVSMSGMACRVSTPKEYFNTEFLERDNQGLPKAPKTFQRQYVLFKGGRDGSGTSISSEPVQTTQPNVNYEGYMSYAQELSLHIMQGIVSPATLGIDIAKKDNANAQREKEKVTVFTRRLIINSLSKALTDLINQALCINEYLTSIKEKKPVVLENGKKIYPITSKNYSVHCEFEEFADASFENKATIYGNMLSVDSITPELYVEQLWKDGLTEEQKKIEVDYIKKQKEAASGGMGDMFGEAPTPNEIEDEGGEDISSPDRAKSSKERSEEDLTNQSFNRNNE